MRVALLPMLLAAHAALAQSEPAATRPTPTKPPVIDSGFVARQDSVDAIDARPPSCWRARSHCRTFFITDIGFEYGLFSTEHDLFFGNTSKDLGGRLVWTVGVMGASGNHAHGGAVSLTTMLAPGGVPVILEYRYRNWRGGEAAFDAGLGWERAGVSTQTGTVIGRGGTVCVGYTPNRWFGVNTRVTALRSTAGDHRAVMVGMQSTRLSEYTIRFAFVETARALLGRIGINLEDE